MSQEDRHMLADIMIGGNHLASALVHNIGSDFAQRFPPTADPQDVIEALRKEEKTGNGQIVYDAWVCWAAIMRAKKII